MSNHLTKGTRRELFRLAWPVFFEVALFSAIGSVDVMMLAGHSDNAAGGVGVANQIIALIQALCNIITTGTGILCAQYIGAGHGLKEKQPLVQAALLVNGLLGLLFSFSMVAGAGLLLHMMNVEGELFVYGYQYLSIVGGGLVLQVISMAFSVLSRSHGKTKAPMVISVLVNVINLILNYILIYGKLGLPVMGAAGAAIATVISTGAGCVMGGVYVFTKVLPGMSFKPEWRSIGSNARKILAYGVPAAGEQLSYTLSKLVLMAMITSLGAVAVNANSYVSIVTGYVYLFASGLGQAAAIMVGWDVGRQDLDGASSLCRFSVRCSFAVTMTLVGIMCLLRWQIMDLFTDDGAIIALGAAVMLTDLLLDVGRSHNMVLTNALRATGDVRFPLYIGLFSMWVFNVGVAWLLGIGLGWGLVGIWIALGLDECFRAAGMKIRWRTGAWKRYAAVNAKEPAAPQGAL